MRGPFSRLRRKSAAPAFVETRLERLASYPPMPPPPPPVLPLQAPPQAAPARPSSGPQVKLILADGSESQLPADPELAARAEYLVKSMLPPRPPEPPRPA